MCSSGLMSAKSKFKAQNTINTTMFDMTHTQLTVFGVTERSFFAFYAKYSDSMLIEWLSFVTTGYHKYSIATIMHNSITVWKILRRVSIAARITDRERLMGKQTDLPLMVTSIHDMDIAIKCIDSCINCIIELQYNSKTFVRSGDTTDECTMRITKTCFPIVRVTIQPANLTIHPHAYMMTKISSSRMIFKAYIWIIKIMYKSEVVNAHMQLAIAEYNWSRHLERPSMLHNTPSHITNCVHI